MGKFPTNAALKKNFKENVSREYCVRTRELLDMGVFEETPSLEERRKRVDTNVA